jgi:hypothetical protein
MQCAPFRCNDDRDFSAPIPWLQLVLRGTAMISLFMMSRSALNEPLCEGVHRVKNTAFKTAVRGGLEVGRSGSVFQRLPWRYSVVQRHCRRVWRLFELPYALPELVNNDFDGPLIPLRSPKKAIMLSFRFPAERDASSFPPSSSLPLCTIPPFLFSQYRTQKLSSLESIHLSCNP